MQIRSSLIALSCALLIAPAISTPAIAQAEAEASADEQLQALYEVDWAWQMEQYAWTRDEDGELTSGDRLPAVDPETQAQRLAHRQETLRQLDAIPVEALSDRQRINASVFRTNLEIAIADGQYREWEAPLNSDTAFWTGLNPRPGRLATSGDYRRFLGRLRDIPRNFSENIANMRAGLERGFTVPQVTLAGRDAAIEPYANPDPEANPFYAAFRTIPATVPAAEHDALRAEAQAVIRDAVAPAFADLLRFYREDYYPNARTETGASTLPDGPAYYAAQIREYTTLDLSAEEIHQIGLDEVARIRADMEATIAETGFEGSFDEFLEFLRTDPQFYAETPEELMMFTAWVAVRANATLGDVIGLLPRRRYTILPVPDEIAPFYTAGRGGLESCLMNTYNLPSRPLYNLPALTLHECAPGHSMQAALAEERESGPEFRRYTYFSGYGEGWGLYTEYLGIEMGIYRTPYENFGRMTYEMWRAARLVIDTGLHHYGWSRQQAIDYLSSNTALSDHEVETEIDRYISWPGQALAYKLGELTIRRLRGEAEAALGEDFDRRTFHDAILALGSVPLSTLESEMRRWIADQQG
ncbi:DUF885 family protein [Parasphingopyxis sp. CP4]|uniref:DUF885 domain-containing protein n=1 Tax=Parasphingopyxis sp. CP4 TaxID=2724527 RepID=UPI0015A07D24|nr:DUF885 family protein [Parasphingopyxis sp. CP4]QLC23153.1 DUF885 family protein [Parasphingopyxis sp. CP4]